MEIEWRSEKKPPYIVNRMIGEIEWKSSKPPYLFRQLAEWSGIKVHRARVRPGRMLEHRPAFHEINVALSGDLVTQKISAAGRLVSTSGGAGTICVTPAGPPVSGHWNRQTHILRIMPAPACVRQHAHEQQQHLGIG